ncbi:MAG: glycogen-binding domain-containing protein [Spirochaetales bacterium]
MKQIITGILILLLVAPAALFASEGAAATAPLPPPSTPAPDNINTFLHIQVNNLTKALPPQVQDRRVLLTFQSDHAARYVAVAFAHEEWRVKHLFFKNQNNVYFLVYDLAADTPIPLDYRYIVDGLWQSDPYNKNRVRNDQGIVLSRLLLQPADLPHKATPEALYNGEVEFRFVGKPGLQVALSGNFNNWDPFTNFLEEEEPGQYAIKLVLPPGVILYQFVTGTRALLDPMNSHTGHDENGDKYSIFENIYKTKPVLRESTLVNAESHG